MRRRVFGVVVVVALIGAVLGALLGTRRSGRDPEAPTTGIARVPSRQPAGPTLYAFALWLVPTATILIASSRELWFALPIYTDRYTLVAAPGLVLVAAMRNGIFSASRCSIARLRKMHCGPSAAKGNG